MTGLFPWSSVMGAKSGDMVTSMRSSFSPWKVHSSTWPECLIWETTVSPYLIGPGTMSASLVELGFTVAPFSRTAWMM